MDMKYIIGIIFIINSETHVEWRTIKTDCQSWWDTNVVIIERTEYKHMQNIYLHFIDKTPVMGYICKQ
jgi:hypothetical protein